MGPEGFKYLIEDHLGITIVGRDLNLDLVKVSQLLYESSDRKNCILD